MFIFDYDVYYGNGMNDIFWDDDFVLFIFTYEDGSYSGTGKIMDMGEGDGLGVIINIFLFLGSGDKVVLSVLEEIVVLVVARF